MFGPELAQQVREHGVVHLKGLQDSTVDCLKSLSALAVLEQERWPSKVQNPHAIAICFMDYNFARIHQTLRCTPAIGAGVTDHVWSLEEIVGLLEQTERAGRVDRIERVAKMRALPLGLPEDIATVALTVGADAAWRPSDAYIAVQWLGKNNYAVLGTELWAIRDGVINSVPNWLTIERLPAERWASFVERSSSETLDYLRSFDETEKIEAGELYINVVWASETDFQELLNLKL
jgi:hypothetical protein